MHRSYAEQDRDLLKNLTERELEIAGAARRLAFDQAGDWLTQKQTKAQQFPGGNRDEYRGRAAAYQNAAIEIYSWAADGEASF